MKAAASVRHLHQNVKLLIEVNILLFDNRWIIMDKVNALKLLLNITKFLILGWDNRTNKHEIGITYFGL